MALRGLIGGGDWRKILHLRAMMRTISQVVRIKKRVWIQEIFRTYSQHVGIKERKMLSLNSRLPTWVIGGDTEVDFHKEEILLEEENWGGRSSIKSIYCNCKKCNDSKWGQSQSSHRHLLVWLHLILSLLLWETFSWKN